MADLEFPENQQIRTTGFTADALPITADDECSVTLGMVFVDDYNLYNDILSGMKFTLQKVDNGVTNPPYWLKIVPVESQVSDLISEIERLKGELQNKDLEIYELVNIEWDA